MDETYLSSLLVSVTADLPRIDASAKSLMALLMTDTAAAEFLTPPHIMLCAKALLQTIQATELKDVEGFAASYPQGSNQSADDRLTEICRFKVILAYRASLLQKQLKVSQNFGKLYFLWTREWEGIKVATREKLLCQGVCEEGIDLFLNKYEASLFHPEQHSNDADLIWADNFNLALRERQQRRAGTVQSRLDDLVQYVIADEDATADTLEPGRS